MEITNRYTMEKNILERYRTALRTQAKQQYKKSNDILQKLIEENIPELENNGGPPKSNPSIKYSCYTMLGYNYLRLGNVSKALEYYTLAAELRGTAMLWCKIGKLSLKENKFRKAAHAFSKGLECHAVNWSCLDNLISILFVMKDTEACLIHIGEALMLDANYTKGLVLRKQIYTDNPDMKEYYQLLNPLYFLEPSLDIHIDEENEKLILKDAQQLYNRVPKIEKCLGLKLLRTIPLPKALEDYTWVALTKCIIGVHMTGNEMVEVMEDERNKDIETNSKTTRNEQDKVRKDYKVEDALTRIITNSLLKSKITSQKSVNYEAYFGTDREKDDIMAFWNKERGCEDVVILLKDIVFGLSKIWHHKWPRELVPMYLKVYGMFREYCDLPALVNSRLSSNEIEADALATLLFVELTIFSSEEGGEVDPRIFAYLMMVCEFPNVWEEEYVIVFTRCYWARCHSPLKDNNHDMVMSLLEFILTRICQEEEKTGEKFTLHLPNCFKYDYVTKQIVEKLIEVLQMINSMSKIEEGKVERPAQLELLLQSLQFTNVEDCFIWAEVCLHESLQNFLEINPDN